MRKGKRSCQLQEEQAIVLFDLDSRLSQDLVFQKHVPGSQGEREDQDRKKENFVEKGNSQKGSIRRRPESLRHLVEKSGKSAEEFYEIISSFYGIRRGIVKMEIRPLLLSGFILLTIHIGQGSGNHGDLQQEASSVSPLRLFRLVSVEDLKRSEHYLRKDLGLNNTPENPSLPVWERSMKVHPVLVFISALLFLGGVAGFIVIFRRQSKLLKEGLDVVKEHESGRGGGIPRLPRSSTMILEKIEKDQDEIGKLPFMPPEKALRKVDNVLDFLRHSLGSGTRDSRISLFRYDENDGQYRICGFSKGREFLNLDMPFFPPERVMSLPLRVLSPFQGEEDQAIESKKWIFPFVVDSGGFCLILLEMGSGEPPVAWTETIQESMPLIKGLIARQENLREDVSLTTRDSSGSLDYRATMNRLLEEWEKTQRLGIPFSVIALRIVNLKEIEKYYGASRMEMAWKKLTGTMASNLRPTDWIMRPQEDLVMIQILEAGPVEGRAVMGRISKTLSLHGQSEKLEKGLHYRGCLMSYPPESGPSIHTFLKQILQRLDEMADFEGTYFYV